MKKLLATLMLILCLVTFTQVDMLAQASAAVGKASAATTYKMKAPVIKPNKYGFIIGDNLPKKMDHLRVVATQKDDGITAKIYYDGELIQTIKGLTVGPTFESSQVHYLDANFDGYIDIMLGHMCSRSASALLVWNSQKGVFEKVNNDFNGSLILHPATKMLLLLGSSAACSGEWVRYKLTGRIMKEIDYLNEITDSNRYRDFNVKNRFTLYKNKRITCSTNLKSKLPQEWQQILKAFGH